MRDTTLQILDALYDLDSNIESTTARAAEAATRMMGTGTVVVCTCDRDRAFDSQYTVMTGPDDSDLAPHGSDHRCPVVARRNSLESGTVMHCETISSSTNTRLTICLADRDLHRWNHKWLANFRSLCDHVRAAWRFRDQLMRDSMHLAGELDTDGSDDDGRVANPKQLLRKLVTHRERCQSARSGTEGIEFWTALTSGRWSIIDRFDADGTGYLIVVENTPPARPIRELRERELAITEFATQGRSGKWIALELGISQASVSRCMAQVSAKLGLGRDTSIFAVRGARIRALRDRLGYVALSPCGDLGDLTSAERHVVGELVTGASVAAIAEKRCTSRWTVSNQIASIYTKVGVSSRRELLALISTPMQ